MKLNLTITPMRAACLSACVSSGLMIGGIYTLWGPGWALISGSVPPMIAALVLFRGIVRAQ
jgi:hypothetical protein